ncbi:MAG: hypothetical protein KAJ95_09705, partial [Gammaproteobacteria bacterium]|nr:hypothetical protein [Gammaproteobacteria bacterium]
ILKNDSRRSEYDLTLSDSRRPQHSNSQSNRRQRSSPSSYSSSDSAPHRARQSKTETYSTSPFEAVHRIRLLQKHPHLLIWGSALLILSLIIVVKYLQFPDNDLEVSADQTANTDYKQRPSRYSSKDDYSHNETSDALKFALQRTAPPSTQDRLQNSTERRVNKEVVATEDVSSVINQYMTDEGRAELSLEKDKNNTDIPAQQEILYETDSHITSSPESNTPLAEENINQPQELQANIIKDSSEPPALNNLPDGPAASATKNNQLTNILATTPDTKTTVSAVNQNSLNSSENTLDTTRIPVVITANPFSKDKIEVLIAQYIIAYDSGNLNKMTDLFSENVTTRGGIGIEIVRNDYYKLFRDTAERSIVINNLSSETAGENEVQIHYQAHVQVRSNSAPRWKYYSGGMRLTLTSVDNKLKISALSHTIKQNK